MIPDHAPAGHPAIPPRRVGVLVANLGTPDATDYWSMRRYLNEFLSDRRVIDLPRWKWQPILQGIILTKRPFSSGANYRSIWNTEANESPLMTITRQQVAALRDRAQALWGDRVMVDFCMRYGNPSTESVVDRMVKAGCDRILFLPLYPQYAGATSATANDQFFRALMKQTWQPAARTVAPYFDRPDYIEALAASVERALGGRQPARLVASYHGMPKRYLMQGDPYHCQCQKTSRLLRERLGWPEGVIDTTFQSVFGREEWLKPYTVEHVAELARQGVTRIAVVSPAFSADCVETLEEIQGEIRHAFEAAGGEEFTYIPCLNDDPAHIEVLTTLIGENLAGWV
ncbi:ferrochelatase [Paracoccus yeei]|jgi:ferrochelatase|uniref:Ferrochelatase n=2 Tax=Paracoccus TaxID=265 RepID=A0A1V0GSX3_9RHOB|nr:MULTISPECIES: ferrochelatase [Paracoccus]ARC36931.1 ferrochelatase [Paracoccus yeei]AWX93321.1 ferrochelatase [Paracoccus mutanolyticus]AYF02983.1 ferrochelatase [Paracoccus yeei]